MITLEIAANSWQSCLNASLGGADRIELFENLADGGCTPSAGMINRSTLLSIPVYVMIRPRGGDFCYTASEIDIMTSDIEYCKSVGVHGIVFGVLNRNGEVDQDICKELLKLWNGPATFHRAIDRSADIMHSTKQIVELGFERILSSGGAIHVMDGLDNLKHMQSTYGKDIIIMPGAGVTALNAQDIISYTGCREIHATCKTSAISNKGSLNTKFHDEISYSSLSDIQELRSCLL